VHDYEEYNRINECIKKFYTPPKTQETKNESDTTVDFGDVKVE